MKMPASAPSVEELVGKLAPEQIAQLVIAGSPPAPKYLHWDSLIRHAPPPGLSHEERWLRIKLARTPLYKSVPLRNTKGRPFKFLITDPIPEQLHHIDLGAGGRIGVPEPVTNPQTRDQYYVSSLVEEAITSSQLEGATTTREVAKEMIRTARPPRDRSERMILNNFVTMQRVGTLKNEPLTPELVFQLHRLVTKGTLDDPSAAGRFRTTDENVVVSDLNGAVFHVPPPAAELEARMAALCDFANGNTPSYFIHPAMRAILLHFWLAYDHPFVDGNGRTARALFYWSLLRGGFWLCEYLSISRVIRKAPAQYGRAFLYTETDDNDLTYFLLHQIEVLRRALVDLHRYIEEKAARAREVERHLRGITRFNHRQQALLSHALRHPGYRYTIEGHRQNHNVVYQTARTDLLDLKEHQIFDALKIGKTWYFTPADNLEARLAALK